MTSRILPLLPAGLFYLISLFCPVFVFQEGNSSFLLGLVCLLFGFGYIAWYANLFYFGALVAFLIGKAGWAAGLAAVAIGFGLTTLRIVQVPKDSGGQMTAIVGYHIGFYLWMASMVTVLAVAGIRLWRGNAAEAGRTARDAARDTPEDRGA